MFHYNSIQSEWKEEPVPPFNELIISWNAKRPLAGKYRIYVSVKINQWSSWMLYASWGSQGQSSYQTIALGGTVHLHQDTLNVLEGRKASGFRVKVEAFGCADLAEIYTMHVYTNSGEVAEMQQSHSYPSTIILKVQGLSQFLLGHRRRMDLCSPSATTAVLRYLSPDGCFDPICFSTGVWDGSFDIFGNWVLNAAQAASELGSSWNVWVERLSGFNGIYERLQMGIPVVVSVKGPLIGSALPYVRGHLLAVIGYDAKSGQVVCMDSAFQSNDQTIVRYPLSDFLQAWSRRGRVAYVFSQSNSLVHRKH